MMSIEKWLVTKSKHRLIGPPGALHLIDSYGLIYYYRILIPYQLVQVTVIVTEEKTGRAKVLLVRTTAKLVASWSLCMKFGIVKQLQWRRRPSKPTRTRVLLEAVQIRTLRSDIIREQFSFAGPNRKDPVLSLGTIGVLINTLQFNPQSTTSIPWHASLHSHS